MAFADKRLALTTVRLGMMVQPEDSVLLPAANDASADLDEWLLTDVLWDPFSVVR